MKIFLAGAGGAIGRRLTPLLVAAGHKVVGTTRSADKADAIAKLGAQPVVVDVFDAAALKDAVAAAAPDAIIHQLTDLAFAPGTPQYEEGLARNARIRIEGTANLVAAAKAAGVNRMIAQSIAWLYKPGPRPRVETDRCCRRKAPARALSKASLRSSRRCWRCRRASFCASAFSMAPAPGRPTSLARAGGAHRCRGAGDGARAHQGQARHLQCRRGRPALSSEKAKRDLGFKPDFRLNP